METSVFALHQAAKQNVYENVISLIKIGAEVDERDAKSGQTALHIASAMNNVESIKALLDSGAALDALDLCGDSPLALARRGNKPEAVNLLQEASQRNNNGNEQNGGSTIAGGDKGGRVAMRGADRRKMKLHLESGTGLFENPPPLSPPAKHVATRSAPMTALPVVPPNAARQTAVGGSTIARRVGPGGDPALPPVRRGSIEGPNITSPAGGWKKKDWSEIGASTPPPSGGGKPLERSRGKTEFLGAPPGAGPGGAGSHPEGWKKMKSFFSTSVHPLPSQPQLPLTIESLQAQLQREISERRGIEEELHKFKQRAGPLMHQLKRRYVESDDSNKTLALRNEQLEREVEALKAGKPGLATKPTSPPPVPRDKPKEQLSSAATNTETEAVKSPRRPEDLMTRERLMNAREKKEWRNTQMMMVESHKVERLELMAQVEELKEKLKCLTKDMLEVLDENEKLVKQLEIAEEERDKCIKLMESKIS